MSKGKGFSAAQIERLMQPALFPHSVDSIRLVETHISWVILTGRFAYKIKKPVDLGFLDFSTLEKRHFYCQEEIRLNRRLAADYYLGVVPVRGSMDAPHWDGEGEAIEYAVKMRQFPQEAQLDRLLARGELIPHCMDDFATLLAGFHDRISVADSSSDFGSPEQVYKPIAENLSVLKQLTGGPERLALLSRLDQWCLNSFNTHRGFIVERKEQGFVRECHGDLHLRNMAWIDNKPLVFDCIEFNPELRWIDVVSEIAFLVMDLLHNQQTKLAWRFLNAYLEQSGGYEGLRLLPFYLVYRAMVRAKIAAIRANQPGADNDDKRAAEREIGEYLLLAERCGRQPGLMLILTRGMSASGKSTTSSLLLEALGAIRIRSDVERKRLYGLSRTDSGKTSFNTGIYSHAAGEKTYVRLLQLAASVLEAGYTTIVDASFLEKARLQPFQLLAEKLEVPFTILEFRASPNTLRDRIQRRGNGVSDADLAILEKQLQTWQELEVGNYPGLVVVDTEKEPDIHELLEAIRQKKA